MSSNRVVAANSKRFKLVNFPHMCLTRSATPVLLEDRKEHVFPHRLHTLREAAASLNCLSMSAPKVQWDARVIVLRPSPLDDDFRVFINPDVPGYADRNKVSPMYGCWETDTSLNAVACWVVRPQAITVNYVDEFNTPKTEVLRDLPARLFMHELDFLYGQSMMQQVASTDFIVSIVSLTQMHLWPEGFPSFEARMTQHNMFFDFTTNTPIQQPGLEWITAMQQDLYAFSASQIPPSTT